MEAGSETGGVYLFDVDKNGKPNVGICNSAFICQISNELWHCRFSHHANQVMFVLGNKIGFKSDDHVSPCEICHKAKETMEPFPLSDHKYSCAGDLVHCDVLGPYIVVSKDGYKYFLTVVDDFSRVVWFYLFKSKLKLMIELKVL